MATLAREMPAEVLVGVTIPPSAQTSNTGVGSSVPASTNTSATGIASTQASETENINLNITSTNTQHNNNSNNTVSAAADSSDNQPSTPQPHLTNNNDSTANQHSYANHHIFGNTGNAPQSTAATSNSNPLLNQMYSQNIYAQPNIDLHQQQQQHLTSSQNSSYPSFLNSYEQFYQQQQHNPNEASSQSQNPQQMDFINSNTNSLFPSATTSAEYKEQQAGVRYHPYSHTVANSGVTAINTQNSNTNNAMDTNSQTAPVVSAASSSVLSPRVVSSTSPSSTSNQMQISGSASSIGSMSVGNPSSPNSAGSPQCKKCGIMCTNDSELQEHITNVHGASPYGSSGYASSPYIKEEMQQQTPPAQNPQQTPAVAAVTAQQTATQGVNPGEILDLDSQKLLYSSAAGSMPAMMHANLGNATDPLHGLHSMQQRAGVNSWDQQSPEGLPSYLAQQLPGSESSKNLPNNSTFYQSPKLSPYHITNSSNIIKTDYQPVVKSEYTGDTQQYMDDKSFDPTTPNQQQQQQMMPPAVSSSPAEFPSTTTGGPQDNQHQNAVSNQQFRGGNFEPPSSSSANISTGPIGTKAANWKSNEARRPKTYNCTACNKWFTSSGHLKRHYNTTLHKNAVKSSGQPDPATLPISVHHHPARDPNGKASRGRGSNAAANAANNIAQQQQQPPNPVQPPEPPNSPQGYGGSQVAAAGLTPLPHYTATPSPNSMYEHQYQYVSQVQSTTNASPQHANSMSNHHLLQNQQQQQTVLNGHPNELAGLSVPTTLYQLQTPTPSSQMRGLLNTTMPLSTAAETIHITKIEQLEAAVMDDQHQTHEKQAEELAYLSKVEVKEEYLEEMEEKDQYLGEHMMYSPKVEELESEEGIIHQQLQSVQALKEVVDHSVEHPRSVTSQQIQRYQLDPAQQEDMDHHFYPNNIPSNTLNLPLILSHQLYQEQQQEPQQQDHHQTVDQATYTLMQTPQSNTTGQQYINMPLATNMQPNNMLQLQQQLTTTGQQQLPPATTIPTTNMVNILPLSHQHMQPPPQQHMEQQPQANMSPQLDTTNISIPSHTTTPTTTHNNIISIPAYQLQRLESELLQVDHMQTSPHTIIGDTEVVTVGENGETITTTRKVIKAIDGQLFRLMPSLAPATSDSGPTHCYSQLLTAAQKSPTAGDLPPLILHYQQDVEYKESLVSGFIKKHFGLQQPAVEQHTVNTTTQHEQADPSNDISSTAAKTSSPNKRSRNSSSSSSSVSANSTILPNGRIKCLPCDKEFTKICYLTQHNNSFHSGEYPYRCQKCGKRYQTEDVYIIHLGKHKTTDKAHKCELCPKQFHHKTDLRRHIEAIHTGNKQHSCDICEKSFCRKDHLRKHLETHNRVRAFSKKHQSTDNATANAIPRVKKAKDAPKAASIKTNHNQNDTLTVIPTANQNNLSGDTLSNSAANNCNSLSLLQQFEDVAAENAELLGNGLNEYGGPGLGEHSTDYFAMSLFPLQRGKSQFNLDKYVIPDMQE